MKIATATPEDLTAAAELAGLFDSLERKWYPGNPDSTDAENEPTFFDDEDPAHLLQLWKRLSKIMRMSHGFHARVLFGACALMDKRNGFIDTSAKELALHPDLLAACVDRDRINALNDPKVMAAFVGIAKSGNVEDVRSLLDAAVRSTRTAAAASATDIKDQIAG